MPTLFVLSAGAAKGLVQDLQDGFERDTGVALQCTFGAVGAMLERLNGGAPCDAIILTRAMIDTLAREARVDPAGIADLGWVHTGVALPAGVTAHPVSDLPSLRALLEPAHAIYLPDPERATAGIHALRVLKTLQLPDLERRLRAFPNGAAAMAALAEQRDARAVGITQVSEIRYTPGVQWVGVLPAPHGLATLYSGAAARRATQAEAAALLLQRLTDPARAAWRQQAGFEARS